MKESGFLKIIFKRATIRNKPTPTPTVISKSVLSILPFRLFARTDTSGSAIVIKTPIIKQATIKRVSFLDFVKPEPTCLPIGVIAMSAPTLNKHIPSTKINAQAPKIISSFKDNGAKGVSPKITTISATGKTEIIDSTNLLKNAFFTSFSKNSFIKLANHKKRRKSTYIINSKG